MSAAPDVYVGPAFVGWRSWRILPFERLGEQPSVRLCASGTRGIPKVWEPGRATRALCGKFKTTHEAPWPGCECGVYAYRTRDAAEEHLESFREHNDGDEVLGWAVGRVSLWGVIIECEHGWRGEYAYPYALEVHAEADIAAQVRNLYGIDVEQRPPFPPIEADDEEEADSLAAIRAELVDIRTQLQNASEPEASWAAQSTRWREQHEQMQLRVKALPSLDPLHVSDDEVMLAVLAAVAIKREDPCRPSSWPTRRRDKPRRATAVDEGEIIHALLERRGESGLPYPTGVSYRDRLGYGKALLEVRRTLRRLTADGALVMGHRCHYQNWHWRLSPAGRARLSKIGWPREITVQTRATESSDASVDEMMETREVRVSLVGAFRSLSYPPSPFVEEIAAATPTWRAERQAAQKQPRREYREWLDEQRAECKLLALSPWRRFAFTDEEVLAGLRATGADEPVPFALLRDRLLPGAPGKGGASSSEPAGLSQALVRLREAGLIKRTGRQYVLSAA